MNPPDDLTLKLFLAKQLPKNILIITFSDGRTYFGRKVTGYQILETEWEAITRTVEDKILINQLMRRKFVTELCSLTEKGIFSFQFAVFSPWKTRATALMKVRHDSLAFPSLHLEARE